MAPQRSIWSITSGLDLRELSALVAVAEAGSFRRAAGELGYTQSAVSHQVASLERALGSALFSRPGGRGAVSLTPAGVAAYRHARRALSVVQAMEADVSALRGLEPARIRIGVFQSAAAELLPPALRAFRAARPGVEVTLSETGESGELVDALARGRLDLAFALNPQPDDRVASIHLLDDPWVVLMRRDHPQARSRRAGFEALEGAELVAWSRRWPMQVELEGVLERLGIGVRVVYRTDDNLALQRLVAAGFGVACIGRLAAGLVVDPALTWAPLPEVLGARQVALCHPAHREVSGAALTLIEAIRAQAAGGPLAAAGEALPPG